MLFAGNATLLVTLMVLESYCAHGICDSIHISRETCLQLIVSVEVSLTVIALALYLSKLPAIVIMYILIVIM